MENNEANELPPQIEDKKRHGCLSACLILMILGSVLTIIGNLSAVFIDGPLPVAPSWIFFVMAIGGLLNIVSLLALFKWKKWGFWLFTISALFVFCINLYSGAGIVSSLIGFTGVAFLLGALHVGDKNGWTQLD
jgi:hypothetical protein